MTGAPRRRVEEERFGREQDRRGSLSAEKDEADKIRREMMRLHFSERAKFEMGVDDQGAAEESSPVVSTARAERTAAGQAAMVAEVLTRPVLQKELSDEGRKILINSLVAVPHSYQCPITMDVMSHPVVAADGHTYESDAIESWFNQASSSQAPPTSPMTGERLPHKTLVPNRSLKSAISEFQERRSLITHSQTQLHESEKEAKIISDLASSALELLEEAERRSKAAVGAARAEVEHKEMTKQPVSPREPISPRGAAQLEADEESDDEGAGAGAGGGPGHGYVSDDDGPPAPVSPRFSHTFLWE